MATTPMEFKRGDGLTHYFQLETDSWTPGGQLYFTVKEEVDNDNADAAAVINKSFSDSNIVLSDDEMYEAGWITYRLPFVPTDISSTITFADGASSNDYLGEFTFDPADGEPTSFPGTDDYIPVVIYADIKRGA